MKRRLVYARVIVVYLTTIFHSCIVDYDPDHINSIDNLLVVDGMITNDVTSVRLTRSIMLKDEFKDEYITNAQLTVERDDGIFYSMMEHTGKGFYSIKTGDLDPSYKYRLNISLDGKEYQSDFLYPVITSEIDKITPVKRGAGKPVSITVSTHGSDDQSTYFRWQYKEIWEFKSSLFATEGELNGEWMRFNMDTPNNVYYCWGRDSSKTIILESTNKLSENIISEKKLIEMEPSDERLSILYYIYVQQNQLRKEAFDYFSNIQKNIEQTGGLFSPVPSEMKGNIVCISDPDEPVIGYVEVSTTTIKEQFMPELINLYEPLEDTCGKNITTESFPGYSLYIRGSSAESPSYYAPTRCLYCTTRGTKNKPLFWPTDSQ